MRHILVLAMSYKMDLGVWWQRILSDADNARRERVERLLRHPFVVTQ